jgi:hypothetical protein
MDSQQANKPTRGNPLILGLGKGLTTPHLKKHPVTKCFTGPQTVMDSLEQPRQQKMDVRFGN